MRRDAAGLAGQATLTPQRLTPAEIVADLPPGSNDIAYVGAWTPLGRAVFRYRKRLFHALPLGDARAARGYVWGRVGSGPREVARAILLDATRNEMLAERLCRPYTWEVVSQLAPEGFALPREEVLNWIETRPSETSRDPETSG